MLTLFIGLEVVQVQFTTLVLSVPEKRLDWRVVCLTEP